MSEKGRIGNSLKKAPLHPLHPLFAADAKGTYRSGKPKKGLRTVSVRRPGQKGTLGALRDYGERLVCVRYLKDGIRCKRYKTVEIIIHEEDWTPPPQAHRGAFAPETVVAVRLPSSGNDLRARVWSAGGRWDSEAKVWRMPYKAACKLKLQAHILDDEGDTP